MTTYRVTASRPRNRHTLATTYVRAADKRQAIIIGRRALATRGVKKLSCVTAHEWRPDTDRELLRTGFVGPVMEASR